MVIAIVEGRALVEGRLQRRQRAAQHHVETRLEAAGVDQPFVGIDRSAVCPGVVDHGQTETPHLAIGKQDLLFQLGRADRRNLRRHERLRRVDQHTRWLFAACANQTAARGIGGRLSDACEIQRAPIRQTCMAIDTRQIHRVIRRCGAQQLVRRPLFVGPVVLIPSATDDPFAWSRPCGSLPDHADHLLVGGGATQVDALHAGTEPGEVSVRILQAGDNGPARDVDDTCRRSAEGKDFGVRADPHDPIVANRNRLCDRTTGVNGIDSRAVENEIRGLP